MGLFIWDDKYSVGEALIDGQHRCLFALANKLLDSNNQGELTNNVMARVGFAKIHERMGAGPYR